VVKIIKQPFFPAIFVLSFLSFLLISCISTIEVKEGGNARLIENIPFFPQEDYQCGPASLAGVLNYWGISVTPDDIAKEIFSESARGTLNIDMILYAQSKGLNALQYKGNLEDLKKNIESDYPVIVLVDYGFSIYQVNHFMVVIGYNNRGLIVNSGKDKEKIISEEDFLHIWKRTNYWMLLMKPVSSMQ
jgi:predicted double-glycine peptidase